MEKINRRFLNYKYYSKFLYDREHGGIPDDSDAIVFILEGHRIWARGEEYVCIGSGSASIVDKMLSFDDGAGENKFKIQIDGGTLILTDQNNNSIGATFLLDSKYLNEKYYLQKQIDNKVSIDDNGAALSRKVDKIEGKSLSTNDFTDALLAKLNGLENITIDTLIASTSHPVENRAVKEALDRKIENAQLEQYCYSRSIIDQLLTNKLNKLTQGRGILIRNNTISSTLDTEPFVVVSSIESIEDPNPNKIYLLLTLVDDEYVYDQYTYDGQWHHIGRVSPNINLAGYLTVDEAEDTYQHKGNYLTVNDLPPYLTQDDLDEVRGIFNNYASIDYVTRNFQAKNDDYATKTWVNDYFVGEDEVYTLNGSVYDISAGLHDSQPSINTGGLISGGGSNTTIIYQNSITVDDRLSITSENPVLNKVVYEAIRAIPIVTVDSELSDASLNPVQNRVVKLALDDKADKTALRNYALTSELANKVNVGDLAAYATIQRVNTALSGKQNVLREGRGVHIVNDEISFDIDNEVFVVVGDVNNLPLTNISTNKIYLTEKVENGVVTYVQWKYSNENGQWVRLGEMAPTVNMSQYLKASDAQATFNSINEAISLRLTKEQADAYYLGTGNYLTTAEAERLYQHTGNYVLNNQLVNYTLKSEFDSLVDSLDDYATKDWVYDYFLQLISIYTQEGTSTAGNPTLDDNTNNPIVIGGGTTTNIIYQTVDVDTVLSSTSTNPVLNKVIYNKIHTIQNNISSLYDDIDTLTRNTNTALSGKVNTSALSSYATLIDLQNKVDNSTLSSYATNSSVDTKLLGKQDVLTAGNGISIRNNVISSNLDTDVFVIVDDLPTENISESKIYLKAEEVQGVTQYIEYRYNASTYEWERIGERTPTVDLSAYLRIDDANTRFAQYQLAGDYITSDVAAATYQPIDDYLTKAEARTTYQPADDYALKSYVDEQLEDYLESGDYALGSDLTQLEYSINELYQRKGDYSTRQAINVAIALLQAQIDELYVKKIDVHDPNQEDWTSGGYTPVTVPDNSSAGEAQQDGQNIGGPIHIVLTTQEYQHLVDTNRVNPYAFYFTYEAEEVKPWTFGDEFPITLTDEWTFGGTFPITLTDGNTPNGVGTFPINLT